MTKEKFLYLIKDLSNLIDKYESLLNIDPCGKNRILQDIEKLSSKYLTKNELDEFIGKFLSVQTKITSTKHTKFLLYLLYTSCKFKINITRIIYFLSIVYYTTLIRKYIKFCDKDIFQLAISLLRSNHLFKKFNGDIIQSLQYLSSEITKKYSQKLENTECSYLVILPLIFELRTRIAQSLKRLATKYYEIKRNPEKFNRTQNIETIVDTIYHMIMFYGYIPKISKCTELYNKFTKITYLDENLVKASITEIIELLYSVDNITVQKLSANLNKLKFSKTVLQQLNIVVTNRNLLCYLYTIIKIWRQ